MTQLGYPIARVPHKTPPVECRPDAAVMESRRSHHLIAEVFSRIPPSVLGRLTATKLIVPYYHVVSDRPNVYVKHLYRYKTTQEFKQDLDYLSRHYAPVGLHDILNRAQAERPFPRRAFLLTFDDGFSEMYDIVAPILLERGIGATFFVNSAFIDNKELCYSHKASVIVERVRSRWSATVAERLAAMMGTPGAGFDDIQTRILSIKYAERGLLDELAGVMEIQFHDYLTSDRPYLTSEQIRKLIAWGFTIGGHSIDHPLYAALSVEEQLRQTIESVRHVRETFGLLYGAFAFPHNDQNVSREFFARLSRSGLVDFTFGTGGLIDDGVPNHVQRFSLEKPIDSAARILAFQHARKLSKMLTISRTITRQ